ncbi:MAG: hypothetical protein JWQ12_310 [Glaciihabitans sp.]|nr:hypothetical protein [Glaciihabitans sp.]
MSPSLIGALAIGLVLAGYGAVMLAFPTRAARVFEASYDAAGSNPTERRRRRAAGEGGWTPRPWLLRGIAIALILGGLATAVPAALLAR